VDLTGSTLLRFRYGVTLPHRNDTVKEKVGQDVESRSVARGPTQRINLEKNHGETAYEGTYVTVEGREGEGGNRLGRETMFMFTNSYLHGIRIFS